MKRAAMLPGMCKEEAASAVPFSRKMSRVFIIRKYLKSYWN